MHPETQKTINNKFGGRKKKMLSSDFTAELLHPYPVVVPSIIANSSDGSAATTATAGAFKAYERYRDDGSIDSKTSHVSFGSQDTFSTHSGDDAKKGGLWKKNNDNKNKNNNHNTTMTMTDRFNFLFDLKFPCAEMVVKSRTFKRISILLIILNCILCAVATTDFVHNNPDVRDKVDLAKDIFVYVMTAELFLQFLHHGLSFFYNGWLLFDLIFIAIAWAFPNLLVVRTFRVVRTLRLASWIKDLKELVLALLLVIPKMFSIFFLLLILFMIFSIVFTDLFKNTYKEEITDENYFGSMPMTLFTLFQIMTLDGWADICKQIMTKYEWAWAPFISFVIVSSFFFLNLVIAVVCDAVTSVHRDTVVKYIQDDISAATSVREALKVEDRLEELAGSVKLMMQAQITVLETLEKQQAQLMTWQTNRHRHQHYHDMSARGGGGSSRHADDGDDDGKMSTELQQLQQLQQQQSQEMKLKRQKHLLQEELDSTFFGSTVNSVNIANRPTYDATTQGGQEEDDDDDDQDEEDAIREAYQSTMRASISKLIVPANEDYHHRHRHRHRLRPHEEKGESTNLLFSSRKDETKTAATTAAATTAAATTDRRHPPTVAATATVAATSTTATSTTSEKYWNDIRLADTPIGKVMKTMINKRRRQGVVLVDDGQLLPSSSSSSPPPSPPTSSSPPSPPNPAPTSTSSPPSPPITLAAHSQQTLEFGQQHQQHQHQQQQQHHHH